MLTYARLHLLILLSVILDSCNGQSNTQQEADKEIKAGPAATTQQQENGSGEIKIDSTRQTTLDFSLVAGHFDSVYGNINRGFQDKAGRLWFGTTGAGAIRYDGQFFTHFITKDKFNNNSLTPLLEDTGGNIWFGTADGIYRYDGKKFTIVPITSKEKNNAPSFTLTPSPNQNPASIAVTSAMQDSKGDIWLGTERSGVYVYDGKTFTPFLSKKGLINTGGLRLNVIESILEDRKGNIWFASWNNEGLCRYDGKTITSYTPQNGLGDNMIHSLLEDKAGNIWIGTRNHGAWLYDGKSFTVITAQTALKEECIYSIEQDKMGAFWFSTQSRGVWRYDGISFTNFTTKDGLSNNSVFCIVTANNGQLWFGTRGMGLSRYDGKTFTALTAPHH